MRDKLEVKKENKFFVFILRITQAITLKQFASGSVNNCLLGLCCSESRKWLTKYLGRR